MNERTPIHCILPPHMLKEIMERGSPSQRSWALRTLVASEQLRGRREALGAAAAPGTAYDDPVLGKDPQPAHMRNYQDVNEDNGGVHINSGIPNHAFYATAVQIGGHAWEKAGKIWYVALRDRLRRKSGFQQAANVTYSVAAELFGSGSREHEAVRRGWAAVGITAK